ncbi:hypothetical protein VNO80_21698 [Phaseolus coccineus]|uniref:Uncharacterized protein n=1 Tax=Phaseolus coccineus TaxID=3886 RepID=A0AAN9M4B8_PHACN
MINWNSEVYTQYLAVAVEECNSDDRILFTIHSYHYTDQASKPSNQVKNGQQCFPSNAQFQNPQEKKTHTNTKNFVSLLI